MCVGVWRRSPSSLLLEGPNGSAFFDSDDTRLAVTTVKNVVNVIKLIDVSRRGEAEAGGVGSSNRSPSDYLTSRLHSNPALQVCAFPNAEWHDETTMNAPIFLPIHLQLQSRIKLANDEITW